MSLPGRTYTKRLIPRCTCLQGMSCTLSRLSYSRTCRPRSQGSLSPLTCWSKFQQRTPRTTLTPPPSMCQPRMQHSANTRCPRTQADMRILFRSLSLHGPHTPSRQSHPSHSRICRPRSPGSVSPLPCLSICPTDNPRTLRMSHSATQSCTAGPRRPSPRCFDRSLVLVQ